MKPDLTKEHYAAIVPKTIHHEGDERSRTNPGHGYPAHSEQINEYVYLGGQAEMQDWILQKQRYGISNYQIIKAKPLTVNIKVEIVTTPVVRGGGFPSGGK